MRFGLSAATCLLAIHSVHPAQAANPASPVVLELFTSQSCSSCPSADALLQSIAERDPSVLALSYHVDYWDHLNWKDTYSSPANTRRQQGYAKAMRLNGVFTPQLIIGGRESLVGSKDRDVMDGIAKSKQIPAEIIISIAPEAGKLMVSVASQGRPEAELWEIRFDRHAQTQVKAGENGGRLLESVNNVTSIKPLGRWNGASPFIIEAAREGGVAILAQMPGEGRMLGAASY